MRNRCVKYFPREIFFTVSFLCPLSCKSTQFPSKYVLMIWYKMQYRESLECFKYFWIVSSIFHISSRQLASTNGFYLITFWVIYCCVSTLQPRSREKEIKLANKIQNRKAVADSAAESGFPFWTRAQVPETKCARKSKPGWLWIRSCPAAWSSWLHRSFVFKARGRFP